MIISIDIGTSYSTLCFLNSEGKAEPVEISTGVSIYGDKFSLPSAVFADDKGEILVGQAAMKKRAIKPQNFRMEFKRNLGQNFPIVLGSRSFLPEDLYAELFKHMLKCLMEKFNQPIEKAYITYPASFGAAKQEKIKKAANDAGIFNTVLISEPSAAAMCYGVGRGLKENGLYMVYDFGGGTFDTALVQYENGNITQIGTPMGIEHCGGSDIDRLIYEDIKNIVPDEVNELLSGNKTALLRFETNLAETAVEIKHQLTFAETAEECIPAGFDSIEYILTREKLNSMIAGMIEQTVDCCRTLLSTNKKSINDLNGILPVGGTSRIPLVRDMLKKMSEDVEIIASEDPELSVAQGAVCWHEKNIKNILNQSEWNTRTVCWHEKDIKKSKKNILMKDALSGNDAKVFGSSFLRRDIRTITFLDTLDNMPKNAWDVSENNDASVFAWVDGFDLYVGADGKITAGTDCTELFAGYSSLKDIAFNNCFDTSLVTNMSWMFWGCKAETLDLSSFDTSSVTDMRCMFSFCEAETLDLSSFDTFFVTHMSGMFYYCKAETLDLSSFDTSSVTDMRCMFSFCEAAALDLSNFDTSSVTDMSDMFAYCDAKSLDLSSFDTSSVTDMRYMFKHCKAEYLNLKHFDLSSVTDDYDMFDGCTAYIDDYNKEEKIPCADPKAYITIIRSRRFTGSARTLIVEIDGYKYYITNTDSYKEISVSANASHTIGLGYKNLFNDSDDITDASRFPFFLSEGDRLTIDGTIDREKILLNGAEITK